jgi:hypothetical protein
MSTPPPNMLVLFTALTLAHAEGAAEIGIDHLIAALEGAHPTGPDLQTGIGFVPVPQMELKLSEGVRSVIRSLGKIENASVDDLRGALIRAKENGSS